MTTFAAIDKSMRPTQSWLTLRVLDIEKRLYRSMELIGHLFWSISMHPRTANANKPRIPLLYEAPMRPSAQSVWDLLCLGIGSAGATLTRPVAHDKKRMVQSSLQLGTTAPQSPAPANSPSSSITPKFIFFFVLSDKQRMPNLWQSPLP